MKRILSMIVLLTLVFSGCGSESSSSVEEEPAEPAVTVLGRISSISGNDIVMTLGTYGSQGSQDSGAVAEDAGPGALSGAGENADEGGTRRARNAEGAAAGEAPSGTAEGAPSGGSAAGGGSAPTGSPEGGTPPSGDAAPTGTSEGGGGSGRTAVQFRETGESWSGRILVGTPILYGTLNVDFSQLQINYIVSFALGGADGSTVVSGEILSTS